MSKFNPSTDIPALAGKTVVVTGGNAGLGAATVKAIVAHDPAKLFLCARTPSKAEAFITELKKTHPNSSIQPIRLDLASFDSIKTAAKEINASCDKIQIVILNAGVAALAADTTKDGYEVQFGTNHMGHALFTQLIAPKLIAASKDPAADVRVVAVSSIGAHRFTLAEGIAFDKLKTTMPSESPMVKYGHSKLANIHFAAGLTKQYPFITTAAPHPGTVSTEIFGKADAMPIMSAILKPVIRLLGTTADDGAKNQLWCAFGKGVESGKYYEPVGKLVQGTAASRDTALTDKLWEWTNAELASHGAPGWPTA